MFRSTEGSTPEVLKKEASESEKNYVIQKNDWLKLAVFTNNGERLIDPNPELTNSSGGGSGTTATQKEDFNYLVDLTGVVRFPMVGALKLEGLTLRQAEEIAQKEYNKYFKEVFVILSYVNKRVIVLGAPGGQVIPLTNQNVRVAEILAMAKGLSNDAKADNIKLVRGEHVYQIDFSTIDGFKAGNVYVEPGDIIYIEPIRRPISEGLRDYYGVISVIVSLATLIAVVRSLK